MTAWTATTKTPCVWGLRLRPLTLGHLWLLTELDFPLVHGIAPSWSDLCLAALICCTDHRKSRKHLASRWLNLFIKLWGRRNLRKRLEPAKEAKKFLDYWSESLRMPEYIVPESARSAASPMAVRLLLFAMSTLHLSRD